jgi:DNA repair exonuclease SbcCD ATPase subunit
MKILELEIENVRGIRNRLKIVPEGNNLVVYGQNGTGKSGVVDAIDFLFTGDISRLGGTGTRGMSLGSHGPHIDCKPKDAAVRAKVHIEGIDEPVSLERKMSKPKELLRSHAADEILDEVLGVAIKGHQLLTREEILRYIAAKAGERAEQIQAILDLSIIEETRKILVSIDRELRNDFTNKNNSLERSKEILKTKLGLDKYSEEAVLEKINVLRNTLKADPLTELKSEHLHQGITPPSKSDTKQVNKEQFERTIYALQEQIVTQGKATLQDEVQLRESVKKLAEDKRLKKELAARRLVTLGISLVGEDGACPLCLTPFEEGKLISVLEERLSKAKEAEDVEKEIQKKASKVSLEIAKLQGHIGGILNITKRLELKGVETTIESWNEKLDNWKNDLSNASETYPTDEPETETEQFFMPENWAEQQKGLERTAEQYGDKSPEQIAWDTLTETKTNLERYFPEKENYKIAEKLSEKAKNILDTYVETKDKVLIELYDTVSGEFTDFYRNLHMDDEETFKAILKPEGATLGFEVDFYGRGSHHPRALHSEGHQDSMGLCLYLALHKKISEGKVKLAILDDVVMSIDSGHRRKICKLITERFPDIQFIITTHNKTWARQLRTDGVVKSRNLVEFKGWSVDTGPKIGIDGDVWEQIGKKLEVNEIASAAHQLREHTEFFYEQACDALAADVRYKSDGRWELGDYLKGAKKAYKEALKQAKKAANSWGKQEDIEKLGEIETQFSEVTQRTQSEHWGVNENVHYSKWADFTKDDFLPIAEAFQDMEGLFCCPSCNGMLALAMREHSPIGLKCLCGNISWNLESNS